METLEAIYSRHSVGKVSTEPLPREVIEKLLSAGVQAPNHFKARPWRFVVITGQGLEKLGEAMAASFKEKNPDAALEAVEFERNKPRKAPLVIAVASEPPQGQREDDIENISAVAAACQNILLAAHDMGLGAIWKTGNYPRDTMVKDFLGFSAEQHLIGLLFIGKLDHTQAVYPERPSFEDRTVWME